MKRLMSVLTLVVLAGCGEGNSSNVNINNPVAPTRAALLGTWRYTSLQEQNAAPVTCPGGILGIGNTVLASCGANDIITFNSDDTFTSTRTNGTTVTHPAGTWGLSGSTLTLTQTAGNAGITDRIPIALSTDGTTLTEAGTSYTTTLTKQ